MLGWAATSGPSTDGAPTLQAFTYYAELMSAHMFLLATAMRQEGELPDASDGYTADDQYTMVQARLETTLMDWYGWW